MEEIKKWTRRLLWEYGLLWVVAAALMATFECGWLEEGSLTGHARLEFGLETAAILLTLLGIPLSLKLFSRRVVRLRTLPLLASLKAYPRLSLLRLSILAFIVWGNLLLYYTTVNSIGGLCALLGCIASLFCVPGRRRLMNELEITRRDE